MATTLANGSTSKPIDTVSAVTGSSSANPIESDPATTQSWIGAFLILLPIVPIIATIVCIATYLGLNLKAPALLFDTGWLNTVFPYLLAWSRHYFFGFSCHFFCAVLLQ